MKKDRKNAAPPQERDDPLLSALKAGDVPRAQALLDQRESLSWRETADYAGLALHQPVELLRQILDLGPNDQIYCAVKRVCPGGAWEVQACATLLEAAAALDDLDAVEELLKRNSCHSGQSGSSVQLTSHDLNVIGWYKEKQLKGHDLNAVGMKPLNDVDQLYQYWCDGDPLAAAIWCGAVRCVEQLLPERAEDISPAARHVLGWGPLPGDEEWRQTVTDMVRRKYGLELEDILTPDEFRDRNSPQFLSCLKKNPQWFTWKNVWECVVRSANEDLEQGRGWAWNALPLIPEHLISAVVLEKLRDSGRNRGVLERQLQGVFRHPQVRLCADRCAVPADSTPDEVLCILDHMEITGQVPEGGLSGLAAAMLEMMVQHVRGGGLGSRCSRMLKNPKDMAVLEAEDPEMVSAYLDWKAEEGNVPEQNVYLLKNILGLKLREERHYGL